MDKQLAKYFFEEASRAFAFVMNEYSFAAPLFEVDDEINFAFVIFTGKNLAIECILDERETDIDCKIARVFGGEKTSHYAVDESGVRVREGLASLVRRHGVRDRLFERVGGLELHERIRITLADFAQMLKKYGQEVLNDSPTALV